MGELRKLRLGSAENNVTPYTAGDSTIQINGNKEISVNTNVIATVAEIGDLSDLDTTDKTDLVSALNEVLASGGGGGGGGSVPQKAVNFIDYDGTIVNSYTAAEAAALTALPANPSHTGLTAQGWNWTLAHIKSYLTNHPDAIVNVGQMYTTSDGKTRIYVHFEDARCAPYLQLYVNGSVVVDWGDNSATHTMNGTSLANIRTVQHVYASGGDYVITLTVTGTARLTGNSASGGGSYLLQVAGTESSTYVSLVYRNAIQRVEIDTGIEIIANAFQNCYSLTNITIPDSVTSIGNSVFSGCYSLTNVTIPDTVTSIGSNVFQNCYSLASITIPDSVTSIGDSAFQNCYSLTNITIPDSVTSIGNGVFSGCYSLTNVTIPDTVTSIGLSTFNSCYSLTNVTIPDTVTSIGSNAFQNCYSLASITIPDTVTSIVSNAFQNCYSLASITIPNSVTSIESGVFSGCYSLTNVTIPDTVTGIGNNAFRNCYSLTNITIPDSVTNIWNFVFQNCYGMKEYHFLPTTPPTLGGTAVFNNIPSDCIIYVPYSADHSILNAYQTATNWSSQASKMQEEPQ